MRDAIGGNGSPHMDHATAIRHFILTGVFTGVVIINRMHNAEVQNQTIQNLKDRQKGDRNIC